MIEHVIKEIKSSPIALVVAVIALTVSLLNGRIWRDFLPPEVFTHVNDFRINGGDSVSLRIDAVISVSNRTDNQLFLSDCNVVTMKPVGLGSAWGGVSSCKENFSENGLSPGQTIFFPIQITELIAKDMFQSNFSELGISESMAKIILEGGSCEASYSVGTETRGALLGCGEEDLKVGRVVLQSGRKRQTEKDLVASWKSNWPWLRSEFSQ